MKKLQYLAACPLALAATPALAQDVDVAPSGPRIEVLIGYDRVDLGSDFDTGTFDAEDVFYGAAVGYDYDTGFLTIGVEAEVAGSGIEISEPYVDIIDGGIFDGTATLGAGMEYYLGARFGAPVTKNSSVYIKGGWAWTRIDLDVVGTLDDVPQSYSADLDLNGFRVGAGFEQKIAGNAYAKLEYRYTDYSGGEVSEGGVTEDIDAVFEAININRNQIVLGAGVRF